MFFSIGRRTAALALGIVSVSTASHIVAPASGNPALSNDAIGRLEELMGKDLKIGQLQTLGRTVTKDFTVSQWNSLLGHRDVGTGPVVALSDEVDEVALQASIESAEASSSASVALSLPPGTFRLTRPLRSGCKPLTLRGAGSSSTVLVQTSAGQDAWHHGTRDTRCPEKYYAQFAIHDLQFQATGLGGTALVLSMAKESGGVSLQNVSIRGRGNNTFNYWHDGIKCRNCSLSVFFNVDLTGRLGENLTDVGTGVSFTGNAAAEYDWYGGNISGFDVAVAATSGDAQDLEGFLFDGINVDNVNIGYKIDWSRGVRSPQWYIINGQYGNIGATWIDASGIGEVEVANNLTYARTDALRLHCDVEAGSPILRRCASGGKRPAAGDFLSGSSLRAAARIREASKDTILIDAPAAAGGRQASFVASPRAPAPFVRFDNIHNLVFRDNKQEFGSSSLQTHNVAEIFSIRDSSEVIITPNFFADFGDGLVAGFSDRGGNRNLVEQNDVFSSWGSRSPKCAGCLSSGAGARWATYYGEKGCDLGSSGSVTCGGSSVGLLDAEHQLKIHLPAPVFLQAPVVTAANGDYGALAVPCGPVALSVTTTEFVARCGPAPNRAPVRINWTAVGR